MFIARPRFPAILLAVCFLAVAGCIMPEEWERLFDTKDRGAQPQADPRPSSKSKALDGAIGPLVTIDGLRLNQVRGYGLVVDLVDTGGSDAPEVVKRHLVKEMRRQQTPGTPGVGAVRVLESHDTAMVEVTGFIPAAARKGDRFDVMVRALGTQTRSLVSGRLVLCELKLFASTPSGVISGETLARAGGPVFVRPSGQATPSSPGEPPPAEAGGSGVKAEGSGVHAVGAEPGPQGPWRPKVDLRTGMVLGGGRTVKPRRVRLVLNTPSYSVARRIVDRINGRYATVEPIAVGKSPSFVDLKIPAQYQSRKRLFLERVVHTTLSGNPAFLERRAKELAKEITHPDAEFDSIGLAWEAIGRGVVPTLRSFYHHSLPATNYYAGRTGLRLGDVLGMEVVARHARDPDSPFREQAIEELGFAVEMHGAGEHLRKLLDDPDDTVRVRAYRALRRRPHPAIETKVLDQDNLILDVVDSKGSYLIYVQYTTAPRIAVFGKHMRCRPPAIFPQGTTGDDRWLHTQISADVDDETLTVIYKNKHTGVHSPQLAAPLNVAALIRFLGDTPRKDREGRVQALAVPYSEIVDILCTFCESGTIPAKLVMDQTMDSRRPAFGTRRERPETEE